MRIFYTASDIEDLAASGIRQLEVGPGVALTESARERAGELDIKLVQPAASPARGAAAPASAAPAPSGALPAKPRGCQHGPLGGGAAPTAVVDQLVEAVSTLKKRGG